MMVEETGSLLAIDIGRINTQAVLFDVVDGSYRFLGISTAPTTIFAPFFDLSEGIFLALRHLQDITGRKIIGDDELLITPTQSDGSGVDHCVATLSVGNPIKVVIVGLLNDISIESARHLAQSTYARVLETLDLQDQIKLEACLHAILRLRPEAIIIVGGTEGGATHPIMRLVEAVGLACSLLPQDDCPEVLYAGNQSIIEEVKSVLELHTSLHISDNIRPKISQENIEPALDSLADIFRSVRARQMAGVHEVNQWCKEKLFPTAMAFGNIIRFLSQVYGAGKGVLGVDIGASATTIAASFSSELALRVFPQYGLGENVTGVLEQVPLETITRWLPWDLSDDYVRDYIYNKSLYPGSIPVENHDLAIEQALARQFIQASIYEVKGRFPPASVDSSKGLLPLFEPIIGTGSLLVNYSSLGDSLLILLDSLQPTGITTIVLDLNRLVASLGASAYINPTLVVQVIESGVLVNLACVLSPVANVRIGTPILRATLQYDDGTEVHLEAKQGTIHVLPLALGQNAQLHLRPLHGADIGMGAPGRGGKVLVRGGLLGVVIDARGRPLILPKDRTKRRDLLNEWLSIVRSK